MPCKSRFCSSCGKKATDKWIKESVDKLPDTLWQHITFTIPDIYWPLFWYNRNLMIIVPKISVNILTDIAKEKKVNIGILLAIHTFGRDLKRNYHLHLSVTVKGLSLNGNYLKKIYFYHDVAKKKWRYEITKLLRDLYKSKELELPKSYDHFEMILDNYFQKQWVVYFNKSDEDNIRNIEYFGKYVKRPPLGETRIKYYDGSNVKFEYLDHKDKKKKIITLSGLDFVKRLIYHIPDKYFRSIRYYGILANRSKKEKLQIINNLLLEEKIVNDNVKNDKDLKRQELKEKKIEKLRNTKTDYRSLYKKAFNKDPLFCDNCNIEMKLAYRCYISLEYLRKRKSLIKCWGKNARIVSRDYCV